MTLTLRAAPRTGRACLGSVLLNSSQLDLSDYNFLHIGLKSTAGAPSSAADFDTDTNYSRYIPSNLDRTAISRVSLGVYSGQLTLRNVTFTHAPGANVKVYAALSVGQAPATDPFTEVSPGVLLGAA